MLLDCGTSLFKGRLRRAKQSQNILKMNITFDQENSFCQRSELTSVIDYRKHSEWQMTSVWVSFISGLSGGMYTNVG